MKQVNEIAFRVLRTALKKYDRIDDKEHQLRDKILSTNDPGTNDYFPKGSSRLYLNNKNPLPVKIDGKDTELKTGLKVSRHGYADEFLHHIHKTHPNALDGLSTGGFQNRAETHPHNDEHRVLIRTGGTSKKPEFKYNPHGVLPPLIKHDRKHYEWSMVGHTRSLRDVTDDEIKEVTKTPEHPEGIRGCYDLINSVKAHYKYQKDYFTNHPLVKSISKFHRDTDTSIDDLARSNMGLWQHPITGQKHVVILDHGWNKDTIKAYAARVRDFK